MASHMLSNTVRACVTRCVTLTRTISSNPAINPTYAVSLKSTFSTSVGGEKKDNGEKKHLFNSESLITFGVMVTAMGTALLGWETWTIAAQSTR